MTGRKTGNPEEVKRESMSKGVEKAEIRKWQKPTLEDVSEKIMAQPYIRFT